MASPVVLLSPSVFGMYRYVMVGDREPDEVRLLVTVGAALVSYLGMGIALWQVCDDPWLIAAYTLSVFLAYLVLRLVRVARQLAVLKKENLEIGQDRERRAVADGLTQGMLALIAFLTQPPRADMHHHLTKVTEEYRISGDDGIYLWTIEGFNALESPSESFYVKVAGDSPQDLEDIPIEVVDLLHGGCVLETQCIGDRPNCKVYSISFRQPLGLGDGFAFQLRSRWDNTFLRSEVWDYVYSPWGSFATQGIDLLVGRLVSDVPLRDVLLERLEDGQKLREPRQPLVIHDPHECLVEWEIINPKWIYLLSFCKGRHRFRWGEAR